MTPDEYRELAREWCEYAVNGDVGRRVDAPVYRWVTEKRDNGPGYSSCADLGHWLLYRLGIRADYLNRIEHIGWRPVVNVGRLCCRPVGGGADGAAREPEPDEVFRTGDILICWSRPDTRDAHVMVCAEHLGNTLLTWDYGQGPMSAAAWAGNRSHVETKRKLRTVHQNDGRWVFDGGRSIRSVLSLEVAIENARAAGLLADPDLPVGEVLDEKIPA